MGSHRRLDLCCDRRRRRHALSKEGLRRFIRDSATRELYIGSPWIVKVGRRAAAA